MKYFAALALMFIFHVSSVLAQQALIPKKVLYKEFELSFEPTEIILVYSLAGQDLIARKLSISKLHKTDTSDLMKQKYAVFSFVDADMQDGQILISGKRSQATENLSISISKIEFINPEEFKQQQGNTSDLDSEMQFLSAETLLEQKKLAKLRRNVAEISRLNRLVEAENTATSLERRLRELQLDRQALAALIMLIPGQQLTPRQTVIENQLVLDARGIRQAYTKSGEEMVHLSPEKEQQLRNQIEAASKLNAEDLKRRLIELKKTHEYGQVYEEPEQEGEIGSRHNPL